MRLKFDNYKNPLFRYVMYAEWILIGLAITLDTLIWRLAPADPANPQLFFAVVCLAALALMSIKFPEDNPTSDKWYFLLTEIALITGGSMGGVARFIWPLYMTAIAKAALLLDKRGLWITVGLATACQLLWSAYKLKISDASIQRMDWSLTNIGYIVGFSFVFNISYCALMGVVAQMMLALNGEQESRLKAERLTKEVEELAKQLERVRIAREIHDTLGHTLTSLKIQLEMARKLTAMDQSKAEEALHIAEGLASRSLTDVRVALQSIRNTNFNFQQSIDELLREVQAQGNINVIRTINSTELPNSVSYQLYRVIQECLTNTLKHAMAETVSISVGNENGNVKLLYSDDGKGIDAQRTSDGYGMKGIHERIASLGGTVQVESAPGNGIRITTEIPLPSKETAQQQNPI